MNIRTSLLLATLLLASNAHALESLPGSLTIACPASRLPAQAEVAELFGLHNFSQVYAARLRVMQVARQNCHRGATDVRIVVTRGTPAAIAAVAD